jgi:hypothetical protein
MRIILNFNRGHSLNEQRACCDTAQEHGKRFQDQFNGIRPRVYAIESLRPSDDRNSLVCEITESVTPNSPEMEQNYLQARHKFQVELIAALKEVVNVSCVRIEDERGFVAHCQPAPAARAAA